MFALRRVGPFSNDFLLSKLDVYKRALGEFLVREFRVTKRANRDLTMCVMREMDQNSLKGADEGEDRLGRCVAVEANVAVDHAKSDGQLGPRTAKADLVLCVGRLGRKNEWVFAFALTRGKKALVQAVMKFFTQRFGADFALAVVAPHQLVFLAREWTRELEAEREEEEDGDDVPGRRNRLKKLKLKARLELHFSVKDSDVDTIEVAVEEEALKALHALVESSAQTTGREPALVTALTRHLTKHLNVNLNGANVKSIVTPVAEIRQEGYVRFLWPNHLRRALLHLKEIAALSVDQDSAAAAAEEDAEEDED